MVLQLRREFDTHIDAKSHMGILLKRDDENSSSFGTLWFNVPALFSRFSHTLPDHLIITSHPSDDAIGRGRVVPVVPATDVAFRNLNVSDVLCRECADKEL